MTSRPALRHEPWYVAASPSGWAVRILRLWFGGAWNPLTWRAKWLRVGPPPRRWT